MTAQTHFTVRYFFAGDWLERQFPSMNHASEFVDNVIETRSADMIQVLTWGNQMLCELTITDEGVSI